MAKKNGNGSDSTALEKVSNIVEDIAGLVEEVTPELLSGIKIERLVKLEGGQAVRGTYLGEGPHVEIIDAVTGEVRDLATHRIEVKPDIVIRLIESHQLKRELPPLLNQKVRVILLGQAETRGGKRVNDFIVAPEIIQPKPPVVTDADAA